MRRVALPESGRCPNAGRQVCLQELLEVFAGNIQAAHLVLERRSLQPQTFRCTARTREPAIRELEGIEDGLALGGLKRGNSGRAAACLCHLKLGQGHVQLFALREEAWYLVAESSAWLSQQRVAITAVRIVAVQAESLYDGPVLPDGRGFLVTRVADL